MQESVEAGHSFPPKPSFSTRKHSFEPQGQAPLGNVNDFKAYFRAEPSKNMSKLLHVPKSTHGGLLDAVNSDKPKSDREKTTAYNALMGNGLRRSALPGSGIGLSRADYGIGSLQIEGRGRPEIVTAYGEGDGGSLRLEGKTEASFDGGSFKTSGLKVKDAEGCSCTEDKCIRATGTLNARYSVETKVRLPSVSDYPDLSLSQRKRLRNVITTVLAPHEQRHVAAYKKYSGTTSRPFDLTICKAEFAGTIQAMFDEEQAARRQAAQEESDVLDPFYFDFEL